MKFRKALSVLMAAAVGLSLMVTALPASAVTLVPVTEVTFDNGTQQGLYATGNAKARLVTDNTHSGGYALEIYNRDQTWNSSEFDMTGRMTPGNTYRFSAWVYQETGENAWFQLSIKYVDSEGDHYDCPLRQEVASGEWTYLIGKYTVPDSATAVYPYIEMVSSTDAFRVDDVSIVQSGGMVPDTSYEEDIVSLKEAFAESGLGVTVGTSIGDAVMADTSGNQAALITKHFDAVAIENQLKAQYLLDYDACVADLATTNTAPALDFSAAEPFMDFAEENGLTVKAQCLVWFSMTPDWFFYEDYDTSKSLVSREIMLARLESYIKDVLTWGATEYPGVIDTWIVVNEAFDGDTNTKVRDDKFYQTIGEDYVAKAFEYAEKYRPEEVVYLYNDYNMEAYSEKLNFALNYLTEYGIIENGWVDGIGFQCHIKMDWPGTGSIIDHCAKVAALGLSAQVTEIDIALGQSQVTGYGSLLLAYRAQQKRYEEVIGAFLTAKRNGLDLTNITWWGLTDSYTWLTYQYGEQQYPLLFDASNKAKPAFYGVLNALEAAVAALEEGEGPVNLALGKTTGDNGHQDSLVSEDAVDGDEGSRWAGVTTHGAEDVTLSEDFLWVDFGEEVTFNQVKILWEVCYGVNYTIEIKDSNPEDPTGWTTVATVTGNGGSGWKTVNLEEAATSRYMRVNITKKANSWGVSIYELGVYHVPPVESENLAYGKLTGDNGHHNNHVSSAAVDGDEDSRWAGVTTNSAADPTLSQDFLWVDFGEEVTFNNVQILWEACYGKNYTVEIKDSDPEDPTGWTTVATVTGNNGSGWREVILEEPVTSRYMRINITKKDNGWGVSIYELGVYYDELLLVEEDPGVSIGEDDEDIPTYVELPKPVTGMPGDVDEDGEVTSADLTALARHLARVETLESDTAKVNADLDEDGDIGATDLTALARTVAGIE